jgi:hypothetical protein
LKKILIISIFILALGAVGTACAAPAEIPTDSTAATAKGDTKVTIGGELRVRGVVQQNTGDFDKNSTGGSSATVTTTRTQPRPKQ